MREVIIGSQQAQWAIGQEKTQARGVVHTIGSTWS
jgi:hypothetical protein